MLRKFNVKVDGIAYEVEVEEIHETTKTTATTQNSVPARKKPDDWNAMAANMKTMPKEDIGANLKEIFNFDKATGTPAAGMPQEAEKVLVAAGGESTMTAEMAAAMDVARAGTPAVGGSIEERVLAGEAALGGAAMGTATTGTPTTGTPSWATSAHAPAWATSSVTASTTGTATTATTMGDTVNMSAVSRGMEMPTTQERRAYAPSTNDNIETRNNSPEFDVFQNPRMGNNSVLAPVSGTMMSIPVREGSAVRCGDVLCVIHSGDSDSEILSPVDANVVGIFVRPGSSVNANDILITLT